MTRRTPIIVLSCALFASACAAADDDSPLATTTEPLTRSVSIVLEVALFGALPDDELDDTDAIQAAIDAAREVPGSLVRLAAGTYRVSEREPFDWNALRVHEGHELTIAGAGPGQTLLLFESERDAHVLALTDCRDVTLEGLTIDGQRESHALGHGIRVANGEGITLQNLEVVRAANYGIGLQRGALRRIAIDRVGIRDTGSDGIDFNNEWSENQDLVISNTVIAQPAQTSHNQAGIDVRGPAIISAVTVLEVPEGAVGIRLRNDGEVSGLGAHHSTVSDFHIEGARNSLGLDVNASDVQLARGSIAGSWRGLRLRAGDTRLEGVDVGP